MSSIVQHSLFSEKHPIYKNVNLFPQLFTYCSLSDVNAVGQTNRLMCQTQAMSLIWRQQLVQWWGVPLPLADSATHGSAHSRTSIERMKSSQLVKLISREKTFIFSNFDKTQLYSLECDRDSCIVTNIESRKTINIRPDLPSYQFVCNDTYLFLYDKNVIRAFDIENGDLIKTIDFPTKCLEISQDYLFATEDGGEQGLCVHLLCGRTLTTSLIYPKQLLEQQKLTAEWIEQIRASTYWNAENLAGAAMGLGLARDADVISSHFKDQFSRGFVLNGNFYISSDIAHCLCEIHIKTMICRIVPGRGRVVNNSTGYYSLIENADSMRVHIHSVGRELNLESPRQFPFNGVSWHERNGSKSFSPPRYTIVGHIFIQVQTGGRANQQSQLVSNIHVWHLKTGRLLREEQLAEGVAEVIHVSPDQIVMRASNRELLVLNANENSPLASFPTITRARVRMPVLTRCERIQSIAGRALNSLIRSLCACLKRLCCCITLIRR